MARKFSTIEDPSDKHVALVNEYFRNGFNKTEAMRTVGYQHPTKMHSQIFGHPTVMALIEARHRRQGRVADLTDDWIIQRLMKQAMAGEILSKFMVVQADGSLRWDFTGAQEDELEVIKELGVDEYTEGRGDDAERVKKFKIAMVDGQNALDKLARVRGLYKDKLEVAGTLSLLERLQAGRERARQRAVEVVGGNNGGKSKS